MNDKPYESEHFWEWVDAHRGQDPASLRLSARRDDAGIDIDAAIVQVDCRTRFAKKLASTLAAFPRFYFPSTLAGEQSTGDLTADFHRRYVGRSDLVVDLTAGLGNDAMHLARTADRVFAIERNEALVDALKWNARGLGISNLTAIHGDSRHLDDDFRGTVAFIDPARRAGDGSRVFGLGDCEPNVLTMLDDLRRRFDRLVIKASPMLDVSRTIADLPGVTDIYLVGTTTECKELDAIVDLSANNGREPRIHAVTIFADGHTAEFSFTRSLESEAPAAPTGRSPVAGDVLYEPYPATMKAAPVKLLANKFGLTKFHPNTHLYYGRREALSESFPGDVLTIEEVIPWQSKNIKRLHSRYPRISVTVRNFGMSADALRAKLGVRDGGDHRLFGVGLGPNPGDRLLIVVRP